MPKQKPTLNTADIEILKGTFTTKDDFKSFATKDDLKSFATTKQVNNIVLDAIDRVLEGMQRMFDAQDKKYDKRFDQLDQKIDTFEERLSDRIDNVRAELKDDINGLRADLSDTVSLKKHNQLERRVSVLENRV